MLILQNHMAVKSPEERRTAALRDIGTLLQMNFGGNANPRDPPRDPRANPLNGLINLDGENDVEELPVAPLNNSRRSLVL